MKTKVFRSAVVVVLAFVLGIGVAIQSQPAHASTLATSPVASSQPTWVEHANPFVHISANFIATLAPEASKHLSRNELQSAERAIAEYNALSYAKRSNDPSTHRAIALPHSSNITANFGCPLSVDQAYYVYSWYGTGIYFHFSQCYVNIGIAAFAAGSGTSWVVAAVCALSIIGNLGCSEVAGVIAAVLAAGGGILYLWDATCNSSGVGITFVEPTWWHGAWAYPSC